MLLHNVQAGTSSLRLRPGGHLLSKVCDGSRKKDGVTRPRGVKSGPLLACLVLEYFSVFKFACSRMSLRLLIYKRNKTAK